MKWKKYTDSTDELELTWDYIGVWHSGIDEWDNGITVKKMCKVAINTYVTKVSVYTGEHVVLWM